MAEGPGDQFRPKIPERVRKAGTQYTSSLDKIAPPPKKLTVLYQDTSLITQLAYKLKSAEYENENLRILLRRANDQNLALEKQVYILHTSQAYDDGAEFQIMQLRYYSQYLEYYIYAMEQFLDRQGLIYVESDFNQKYANYMIDEAVKELELEGWKPPSMDELRRKVDALNRRFYQKEFVTEEGITQHYDAKGLQIIFFSDGIFVKRGPFRAYSSNQSAVQFVKDVVDGFVPSELYKDYPDGISMEAVYEDEKFVERKMQRFSGAARATDMETYVVNPDQDEMDKIRANYYRISGYKAYTFVGFDDQKSSYLNPIPLQAIMNKIADKSLLTGQVVKKEDACMEKTIVVDRAEARESIATLRLLSSRNEKMLLKLPFDANTTTMYEIVAEYLGLYIGSFAIYRALGGEVYAGMSLEQAGLVPNCRLMIKIGV